MRKTLIFLAALYLTACASSKSEDTVKILFMGDTGFGESYEIYGAPDLDEKGYDYSFKNFEELLAGADFNVLNLETPLTDLDKSPFEDKKDYIHYADPKKAPAELSRLGIDLVSLANNHTLDYGNEGLSQTLDSLAKYGIDYFGAGNDKTEAAKPFSKTFDIDGKNFELVVITAFEYVDSYDDINFYAENSKPGVNMLNEKKIAEQVRLIKADRPESFVVVFPHWGENYVYTADKNQREIAHALIDAGADMIIGSGAHMIQEIEKYEDKWIFYGLGNFVFNSPGRYQKLDVPSYSAIMELELSKSIFGIEVKPKLYPIFTDNLVTDYMDRFLTPKETEAFEELISADDFAGELEIFMLE